jgi:alkanesulfonate monooxygenase SsuD/methylene tetrahydromethanopterin reductase-like flavin-dependent oxidoreductase (luciferase family)
MPLAIAGLVVGHAQVDRAGDGFASVWMPNIFGLEALTSLAVAGSQVPGIELGTAVVSTYPRHPGRRPLREPGAGELQ